MQQPPDPNMQYPPQQQWQQPPMPPQQEWNPQQQPYPPQYQPPMLPPQVQPPERKSRRRLWLIISIIVLVLVVGGVLASQAGNKGQPAATPQATQSTQQQTTQAVQPTTQPTQASTPAPTVGKPFVVNGTWTVTVNSVKTSQGTEFDTPKAGNVFLVANVTLKNTSSQVQPASSLIMFSLKDTTGQTYTQAIAFGQSPDGQVAPNGLIRGDIAYEVPASIHRFILQFVPDIGGSDLVEWNLSI